MKVVFDYWLSFGPGDSGESIIEMEVTEEEYLRLKEAYEPYKDFYECESVRDIYKRACDLADEDATCDLVFAGILEEGRKASDLYSIGVNFPSSFEDEYIEKEDRKES